MLILFNIFSLVNYILYVILIFEFYMVQIWVGLGPTRSNEDTTCFSVRLSHCFYYLD
jgi:hypothetical protein